MAIDLINILSDSKKSRKDKILVILYSTNNSPKTVIQIKKIGIENGLGEISKWNISMVLKSLNGFCTKINDGWILTSKGLDLVNQTFPEKKSKQLQKNYESLLKNSQKISSKYVRDFIIEAIHSLEYGLLKSAVVFSWIGGVSILYEEVLNTKLREFNTEATRRFPRWTIATTVDGLTKMKEYDFLQVIEGISLIGKNTKNELENCLKLRNSCGHPSTLQIGEQIVAAHIETLLLNIYLKF